MTSNIIVSLHLYLFTCTLYLKTYIFTYKRSFHSILSIYLCILGGKKAISEWFLFCTDSVFQDEAKMFHSAVIVVQHIVNVSQADVKENVWWKLWLLWQDVLWFYLSPPSTDCLLVLRWNSPGRCDRVAVTEQHMVCVRAPTCVRMQAKSYCRANWQSSARW